MLARKKALETLKIDDKVTRCPIQLFKNNTFLLYMGRCRKSVIVSAKGEDWVGKKEIFERQFGYLTSFIAEEKFLKIIPKIGDIIYVDPYTGELVPFEIENELLYYKVVKLDEINLIIK